MVTTRCTKGHEIKPEDVEASNGMILPCGCPAASIEGRRDEGLPDHGALFQVPVGCEARNLPPEWVHQAARMLSLPNIRIKRWRLSEAQADELRGCTGQTQLLFGYPTSIKP